MDDKTTGLLMLVLGIVMAILILAVPGWIYWVYWIVVAILIIYGLFQYFR